MKRKLGKTPARPEAITFKLSRYIGKLPTPPAAFRNMASRLPHWGIFANDEVGDCVWAGAANETRMWEKEAGHLPYFSTKSVLQSYTEVTGYDPSDPNSDQGTDMQMAASYRRKTGIIDGRGHRHKIDAYVKMRVGDVERLKAAVWLFGGVGLGIQFPSYAEQLFDAHQVWTVQRGPIAGGHYLPAIGWSKHNNLICITWGRMIEMSPAFFLKYADEVCVYLDYTRLTHINKLVEDIEAVHPGTSPEGFDVQQLTDDLQLVSS